MNDFIKQFGYPVGKLYGDKVEYRQVSDLDSVCDKARDLIKKLDLPLEVVTNGSLAQTKSFIVKKV